MVSFGRNSAGALEITDANDYYPFGMNHLKTGNAFYGQGSYKNYKYNGKELQETGMYDYGARFYMPELGIFAQHDPIWITKKYNFTSLEKQAIREQGYPLGCHTCGQTSPGTKSGNRSHKYEQK